MTWQEEYEYWIKIRDLKYKEAEELYRLASLHYALCGQFLGEVADAFEDCAVALEKLEE